MNIKSWFSQSPPEIPQPAFPAPQPPRLSPSEEKELEKLEKEWEENCIQNKVNFFKSMSAATREEIIKNEELHTFYGTIGFLDVAYGTRLEELRNKLRNYYGSHGYAGVYRDYSNFTKTLPSPIGVPLDILRRAHLDACAEDMINKKL